MNIMKYLVVMVLSILCWFGAFSLWQIDLSEIALWRSVAGAMVFYVGVCITQTL